MLKHRRLAYKFAVSGAEATGYVAPIVSLLSMFRVQNIFSALASRYLPWTGIQPKYPHKIGAFYVPVWAVDAAVEAKVWLTRRGEEESKQVRLPSATHCSVLMVARRH